MADSDGDARIIDIVERFRYAPCEESEALNDGFVKKSSAAFGDYDWAFRSTSLELSHFLSKEWEPAHR